MVYCGICAGQLFAGIAANQLVPLVHAADRPARALEGKTVEVFCYNDRRTADAAVRGLNEKIGGPNFQLNPSVPRNGISENQIVSVHLHVKRIAGRLAMR